MLLWKYDVYLSNLNTIVFISNRRETKYIFLNFKGVDIIKDIKKYIKYCKYSETFERLFIRLANPMVDIDNNNCLNIILEDDICG